MINPPCYLRGEFLETLCSERACGTLRGCRQYWGYSEMKPGMKSGCLICDPEVAIELLDLVTQSGETARNSGGIADVVVRPQEKIKSCFDERGFCGAGTFGGGGQPRGHLLGEINANPGFHGRSRLNATRGHHPWCKRTTSALAIS